MKAALVSGPQTFSKISGEAVASRRLRRPTRCDALQSYLAEHGCETLVHYPTPVYRMLPYRQFGPAELTASDRLSARILSLPMGPHLSLQQAHEVCKLIREFFARR